MSESILIAGVLAAGILCQWVGWRLKIPAILPLLAVGVLVGPVLNWLHPQETLGELFFPLVSFAVAIILFEGALTLAWREVRAVASTVRNLLVIGALITWFGGAAAAHYIMGLPWNLSLLFGALIIVTGPTVIAPLLRNVRPTPAIGSVLKWEGILIDPVGATVAVLVFEYIAAGVSPEHTAFVFLQIVAVGLILGLAAGYALYYLIQHYLIPDYLRDVAVLAMVIVAFAISNELAHESGLLTVTVMGILLANRNLKQLREIWFFKEKLSVLLISTLFILLAANTSLAELQMLNWQAFAVLAVVILVLRPLGVQLSAMGSKLSRNERLFLSWIAPRGIVAAAISSLFAYELVEYAGYEEARIIAPLTFLIIVGTVLIQGSSARRVAEILNVREAEPQGFLILGAHRFASALGRALKESGFVVRSIDTNWNLVRKARMEGLTVYHGNILSEHMENELDLSGIGHLLALTANDEANALACKKLEEELGSAGVFQLAPQSGRERNEVSHLQLGRILGGRNLTYTAVEDLTRAGATIKRTRLTPEFTYADFRDLYGASAIPLMVIRNKMVEVATLENGFEPQPGWTLLSLQLDEPVTTDIQEEKEEEDAVEAA
ncbi:MAG: sodium:proton antiporter [Caldilineaceae bacterium]|nr:sodium:proton antiporter [Caldilineaceae bacterium]MCB0143050.1 sodium:proton antiporter [Caldilineaceae bacterium]